MSTTIRILRHLDSPIPELPELADLVGKDVEIVVREAGDQSPITTNGSNGFHPVGDWDGPAGEFDRLMQEVRAARDADIEVERESRP